MLTFCDLRTILNSGGAGFWDLFKSHNTEETKRAVIQEYCAYEKHAYANLKLYFNRKQPAWPPEIDQEKLDKYCVPYLGLSMK